MLQEHNALKETNKYLETKVKTLTTENNQYIKTIIDLKEKQIEKLNEANDLIKELNEMRYNLQKIKKLGSTPELINSGIETEELKQSELRASFTPKMERSKTEAVATSQFAMNDYAYFSTDVIPSTVSQKFLAHEKEATCLAFNLSGNNLATGGGDALVKIWDINKQCEL